MKTFYATLCVVTLALPAWAADPSPTLGLNEALDKALRSSPVLGASRAELSAAYGTERQAGVLPNPEVGIEAANLAGSGPYKNTGAAEYTYSVAQKIELGGKRASRQSVAGAERKATDFKTQAARLDVIRDVTVAYGEVLSSEERLKLVEAREKLAREVLENVSRRVGAARDPLIYKNQAEVVLATTALERQKAGRDAQLARRKLASLWGESTFTGGLDNSVLETGVEPAGLEVYQSRLSSSPDLVRLGALREARVASLRLEKSQRVPDPAVSVGVRDFRENGHRAMVVGLSMPIPVFDRNHGNIERAGAEILQAEEEVRSARLQAEQEVQQAWQEWQSAHAEVTELKQRIVPSAEEALKLSRQGFERGRFSFLEVLNAQRTLAEAQEQQINAEQRRLNAKASLERLAPETPAIEESAKGETK